MADSTVLVKSSNGWKFKAALGAGGLVVIVILAFLYRFEFGIVVLAVGLGGAAVIWAKAARQYKLDKFERRRLEAEIKTLEYAADKARIARHFHETEAGVFHINHPDEVVEVQQFYPSVNASKQLVDLYDKPQLPAPEPIDLLSAFTQPQQCYAIIGGQQTGKTFQARHIAAYWLSKRIQPWVVAPKWDKDEWNGCKMFGGLSDFESVRQGINIVRSEANKRHADKDARHRDHALLPIFFDDWTVLVEPIEEASNLILEATTLYASVNIILYFIIHSDTTDAWGVKAKGAALKNNFCKLFIEPDYNSSGQVVRQNVKGYILFPSETERRPARLFSGMPIMPFEPTELEEVHIPELDAGPVPFEPTLDELKVYELHLQGKSLRGIYKEVYGKDKVGGWQLDEIKEILRKFGVSE